MRVKTSHADEDDDDDVSILHGGDAPPQETVLSPKRPDVGRAQNRVDEEGEEEEEADASRKNLSIVAGANNDEGSSDWSTDSGDLASPYLASVNRRVSPPSGLSPPHHPEPEEAQSSAQKSALMKAKPAMKKSVSFNPPTHREAPSSSELRGGEDHEREEEPRKEAEAGEPSSVTAHETQETQEEPDSQVNVKKPKKKKGADPLHSELQKRLGLKTPPKVAPKPSVRLEDEDPPQSEVLPEVEGGHIENADLVH